MQLVINSETIDTTPEHPLLATSGKWMAAGELQVGDVIRNAAGETGVVETVEFVATPQVMYNMTVDDAHTYTVGDGEWVVHNACRWLGSNKLTNDQVGNQLIRDAQRIFYQLPEEWKKTVIAVGQGGNDKIVTAFINTHPDALKEIKRLASSIGARYVKPWEIARVLGSGHAEQIVYRELSHYADLKIGITRYAGPRDDYCKPFFLGEQFFNVFYPARK